MRLICETAVESNYTRALAHGKLSQTLPSCPQCVRAPTAQDNLPQGTNWDLGKEDCILVWRELDSHSAISRATPLVDPVPAPPPPPFGESVSWPHRPENRRGGGQCGLVYRRGALGRDRESGKTRKSLDKSVLCCHVAFISRARSAVICRFPILSPRLLCGELCWFGVDDSPGHRGSASH